MHSAENTNLLSSKDLPDIDTFHNNKPSGKHHHMGRKQEKAHNTSVLLGKPF
jgi:hypothetical protein